MTTKTDGWPPGCRVMVTGHRDIRGDSALPVRKALITVLASLRDRHPEGLVGVSGMAVGADAEFTEACIYLGVPFVAAVPVEDHDSVWPHHARERYADQLARASLVVNVWEDPRYHATSYGSKMHARNRWMLDHVACDDGVVIAVWDGREAGGTWAAVSTALKRGRKVLVLDPRTCQFRLEKPPPPKEKPPSAESAWPWEDSPFDPAKYQARYSPVFLEEPEGLDWKKPKGFFEDALVKGGYLRTNAGRMMTGGSSDVVDALKFAQSVRRTFRSGR